MKRHVKQCRFGTTCKRLETCAYKHMLELEETSPNNRVISLEKTVKELLEITVKLEAKIISLQLEVYSLKQKKTNEKTNNSAKVPSENELRE